MSRPNVPNVVIHDLFLQVCPLAPWSSTEGSNFSTKLPLEFTPSSGWVVCTVLDQTKTFQLAARNKNWSSLKLNWKITKEKRNFFETWMTFLWRLPTSCELLMRKSVQPIGTSLKIVWNNPSFVASSRSRCISFTCKWRRQKRDKSYLPEGRSTIVFDLNIFDWTSKWGSV